MKEDLLSIISHYGVNHQQRKLNEEVFELQEAIFQYNAQKEACENVGCSRVHIDKCKEHIEEEFADCMVLLEQFKAYYGLNNDEIIDIMYQKIERQLGRIEKEKEKNE